MEELYEQIDPYSLPRFSLQGANDSFTTPFPKSSGIYFIFRKNRLVYVGRTNCIRVRLAAHLTNSLYRKSMKAAYIEFSSELNVIEKYFIKKYAPPLNGRMSEGKKFFIHYDE